MGAFSFATSSFAQSSYDLRSPDGRIEIRIRTAQGIRYDVLLKSQALLENCALSLNVDHKVLGREAKVSQSKERSVNDVLEPPVRQKFAKIRDHYNELRLNMEGAMRWSFALTTKAPPIASKLRFPGTS